MKKKCPQCRLVNYRTAHQCVRCNSPLLRIDIADSPDKKSLLAKIVRRAVICLFVCVAALAGFYLSLISSAKPIGYEEKKSIQAAIDVLDNKGFTSEAIFLRRLAVFRSTDNWLNASVAKENAFAATNFPFEIITIYPDFFTYPKDDIERAAVLLHEAKHLQGADEKEAYEFVWRNREKLGWIGQNYADSTVWREIRKQTRDYVPDLFVCDVNPFSDCTENRSS